MNATTAAIDLAKNVFQVALADANARVLEQHRLTRAQFERFFDNRNVARVVMEACGSAHHWARVFTARGIEVMLLPAHYVRAYVRRSKTDAADPGAARSGALRRHRRGQGQVSGAAESAGTAAHALAVDGNAHLAHQCAARILSRARAHVPVGARTGLEAMARAVADDQSPIPALLRPIMQQLLEEIRVLEVRIAQLERQLAQLARESSACRLLMSIPGVGLLSATAILAATSGNVAHFKSARHFASWFGLTPKESSSGGTRRLGRISKMGDKYLRMLLTHGARSVMRAATVAKLRGQELLGVRHWALQLQGRSNHNKAACALANKMARICYAVLRDQTPFGQPATRLGKKMQRQSFELAH